MSYPSAAGQAGELSMNEPRHNLTIVRAALPPDAALLSTLARQLLLYERSLNEALGELTPWAASADEMRKQILQPNLRFFIAERDGEILGYVKAVIYGQELERDEIGLARWLKALIERTARHVANLMLRRPRPNVSLTGGYIAGAFVREDARRAKVGRALVAAAEEWFRTQGLTSSDLQVLYANENARRFWEEVGYQPIAMGMRKKL
jgi:GNAT superfamily N-acetyltransferase